MLTEERQIELLILRYLIDKSDMRLIGKLSHDIFTDTKLAEFFREYKRLCLHYGCALNYPALELALRANTPLKEILYELQSLAFDNNLAFVVHDELLQRWRKFKCISAVAEIEKFMQGKGNLNKALRVLEDAEIDDTKEVVSDLLSSLQERLQRRFFKDDKTLLTGLMGLDLLLNGIRKGTVTVVMAGTSMGKTSFMVYLSAIASLQEFPVLFLTLEDLKEVIEERFDRLFFADLSSTSLTFKKELLQQLGVKIFVEQRIKVDIKALKEIVQRYVEEGVEVVVIDYGDLVEGQGHEDWIALGRVFEELCRMAEDYKIVLITGSQATREAMSARSLNLAHVGRSFRKVQVAHYVIALSSTPNEQEKGLVRVFLLKNKFGKKGMGFTCKVDWSRCWFQEVYDEGGLL